MRDGEGCERGCLALKSLAASPTCTHRTATTTTYNYNSTYKSATMMRGFFHHIMAPAEDEFMDVDIIDPDDAFAIMEAMSEQQEKLQDADFFNGTAAR